MLLEEAIIKLDIKDAILDFENNISSLRTGLPSVNAFKEIAVEYYSAPAKLNAVGSYSQNGLAFTWKIFDPSMTKKVEDAINNAQIGASARASDSVTVNVNFVPMTGEVRQAQVKLLDQLLEDSRIRVRQNIRRKYMEEIGSMEKVPEDEQKRSETRVQELVDECIADLEEIAKNKEKSILEV